MPTTVTSELKHVAEKGAAEPVGAEDPQTRTGTACKIGRNCAGASRS